MSNKALSQIALGFVFGVFVESLYGFGYSLAGLFLLLSICIFAIEKGGFLGDENIFSRYSLAVIFVAIAIGSARVSFSEPRIFPLDHLNGKTISLRGVIVDEPDRREAETFLTVKILSVSFEDSMGRAEDSREGEESHILVKTAQFQRFGYGDEVTAVGVLRIPEKFEGGGGGEFDYASYLAKDKIFYILEGAKVQTLGSGQGSIIKSFLFTLKRKFIESVSTSVSEPEASLLSGLVVGGKQSLGKVWLERFQNAGVMHIVVLSGYNVTIVADTVIKIFGFILPATFSMFFGVVAIFLFALMTGGSATVVRASIMASIVILARYTHRTYGVTRALIIAGLVMIIHNPLIVVFDPSFQLSFLATVALIYVSPIIEERLSFVPERFHFREILVSTLSTQIFLLPLLLYMTGRFSIVAIPVNLLILGLIPTTMFFGFFTGVIGIFSTILSAPFAYISYWLLAYELKVVEIFSALPFSSVRIPAPSGGVMLLIYFCICTWLVFFYTRKNMGQRAD